MTPCTYETTPKPNAAALYTPHCRPAMGERASIILSLYRPKCSARANLILGVATVGTVDLYDVADV